ncbi:MAG: M67 family metallopeptidase [Euryarchaeota archaeon]|nr:M67 family metallopeptidase [Euryarchaeota archaeon]MDE1836177.1 M67 family metallopeptidase [Euryarchaeota archaeon]MDE1881863.1 M67 family metallopeptidase [Euryarchaeota archaeon]MDE2045460.1 M67 family metallopeptidase [Thermoplasmata archaeon]
MSAGVAPAFDEVELSAADDDKVRSHGRSTYPEEACGMLVGPAPAPGERVRRIVEVRSAPNRRGEDREHRFLIPAEELRSVERSISGTGLEVVGFYHSHPDHPPEPSPFDRDHAWPWYAYLVLRVVEGGAQELNAFELDPERRVFQPRRLRVVPVT